MNTTGIDVQESNERLLKALFSNRGLTYLVEVGAAELGNPVLVVDPTYHYAARAGIELDDADDSAFARIIRSESIDEVIATRASAISRRRVWTRSSPALTGRCFGTTPSTSSTP